MFETITHVGKLNSAIHTSFNQVKFTYSLIHIMIVNENTGLLSCKDKHISQRTKFISFIILLSFTIYYFILGVGKPNIQQNVDPKRNVIFFVTDGMGPTSLSLSRSYRQFSQELEIDDILELDRHLIGSSRTRSNDSLITDSAAGATAFSCALKTYNNAVGVNPLKKPCGTLLEAAKLKGYLTGLVVTTRITDATPAAFSAHADYRFQEDLIALHQIGEYPLGPMVDIMIGGGRTHFYSKEHIEYGNGGSRQDGRNLIEEVQKEGWNYVGNREEFDHLQLGKNVSMPLLALLDDYDIPFDLDRKDEEHPSIQETALTALTALYEASKESDKGFFIMIEGSRIDHAGHQNDPAAQVREVLAFDKMFKSVLDLVDTFETETVVISTSDHETGGLVAARQVTKEYPEYVWFPKVLNDSHHSGEFIAKKVLGYQGKDKLDFIEDEILKNDLGITDYLREDVEELATMTRANHIQDKVNLMISLRSQVGWTTHGHSAVDVNIYAYSNSKTAWYNILDNLQGNHENIEIGEFMKNYLELDLEKVTKMISETKHSPKSEIAIEEEFQYHDEYHKFAAGTN